MGFHAGLSLSALAQTRPLLTEEPTTAPHGTIVLESGVDTTRGEPDFMTGRPRDRWDVPVLRLVYSPADSVEFDVEWTGRVIAIDDPDFGTVSDWGDVVLRAKVRFMEPDRSQPGIGARFSVILPETSFGNGLGPNALRFSAQLLFSKAWRDLTLLGNAGLAIHDKVFRPHEQRDFLAYGLAATYAVRDRATVVAELAGLAGTAAPGSNAHSELRAGLRHGAGRLRWDMALRRGLAHADGTWGLTAGLTLILRAAR